MGGVISDWYLSISLLLYLCYPLLAKLNRCVLILVITLAVLAVEIVFNDNTVLNIQQLCGIARIPMFCWGVFLFFNSKEFKGKEVFIWYLFYACITLISAYFRLHLYWILDTIAPFFLLFLYWLCKRIISNYNWINNGLAILGKYTLEIYVGNLISLNIACLSPSPLPRLIVYTLGTLVLSWILVRVNSIVQAAFKHMNSYA